MSLNPNSINLSLPVVVFVCLIQFHCFTTETIFPLWDITYQIIINCSRLYTFEKKSENDRKDSPKTDYIYPVSILRKSISGRHRPVRVADGSMTARCRFT